VTSLLPAVQPDDSVMIDLELGRSDSMTRRPPYRRYSDLVPVRKAELDLSQSHFHGCLVSP
jgi:hypothetical protein